MTTVQAFTHERIEADALELQRKAGGHDVIVDARENQHGTADAGQAIAGGGYYTVRGNTNRRNKGIYRAAYSDYTGLQAKNSVFGDSDWQNIRDEVTVKIWEFLDRMRAGRFVVTPSEGYKTCRFCDFAAVCRYDKYRIQRKVERPSLASE